MESRSNKFEGKRSLKEIEEELEEELLDQEDHYAVGFGGDGNGEKKKKGKSSSEMEGSSNTNTTSSPLACCLADNCDTDMSEAKRYHKRHKVCEIHAKSPLVLVSGIHQRFCQQCSRFHEVSEFDGNKRSCRSRLAGHNERRRKNSYE